MGLLARLLNLISRDHAKPRITGRWNLTGWKSVHTTVDKSEFDSGSYIPGDFFLFDNSGNTVFEINGLIGSTFYTVHEKEQVLVVEPNAHPELPAGKLQIRQLTETKLELVLLEQTLNSTYEISYFLTRNLS